MDIHKTLWHLGRVANSSILGETEREALKRAEYLLGRLKNISEYNAYIKQTDALWEGHAGEYRKDCRMLSEEVMKP